MEKKRLMIFIPAYKTEKTVCSVIERIPKDVWDKTTEIVVFDNCSPDNTYNTVKNYKKEKGISKLKIFRHDKNLLFGGNIKAACNYAIKHNMDIMVTLHSDGQYPPEKINELIKPIEEEKAQVVLGSRFLENPIKGGMPFWRYLGNIFLTKIENILINHKLSEWHSGFTAYDCNILKEIPFNLCVNGYEWTTDSLLLFIRKKCKIKEIPIPTHYGKESTSPSIKRTFLYFTNSFKIAFLFFLDRIKIIKIKKYNF